MTAHRWPEVLPDGKTVLFTALSGSAQDVHIALLSLDTGEISTLIPGGSNPRYSVSGHIVYAAGGSLWDVVFDAERLALVGNPVPVLNGVTTKRSGAAAFALSLEGSLLYVPGGERVAWNGADRLV